MALGADVIIDVMRSEGVTHVFGNPGSTEMAFIDAVIGSGDMSYVLGLHEGCVISMAEGYAHASGRPAVVNVHTMSGLGNAMGMLTNAKANGAPLVVTAGHQHQKLLLADPLLKHDLTGMAATVSKWQYEPRHADELGLVFRRAFRDVMSPPRGPVFVSLPVSLMDEEAALPVPARSNVSDECVAAGLDGLAERLLRYAPSEVALILDIQVAQADAIDAAITLAEALGAFVHGAPNASLGVFPPSHPLWRGAIAGRTAPMRATLSKYKCVLWAGGQALQLTDYDPAGPLPPGLELLHLSSDASQIGRTYATAGGASGAIKPSLAALTDAVKRGNGGKPAAAALAEARAARSAAIEAEEAQALASYGPAPITPAAAIHAALRAVPDDIIVVDEAVTNSTSVRMYHRWTKPGRIFSAKQIIGWGMGAAVGVAIAHGGRAPVLSITSDGGATFAPQALWTAAREKLPVVFVVLVNREYGILKSYFKAVGGAAVRKNDMRSVELVDPSIDYTAMAQAFGVDAVTVDHADQIGDAVRAALARQAPVLIEIPTARIS